MSKKILAFGASNSSTSINKRFASYAASKIKNADVHIIDLNDYEMPIFSVDRERENGVPEQALQFKDHINKSDGIIISFAEHNGNYTAAFKNIFDWISRIEKSTWNNKPMFLLGTSPGSRGAQTVLGIAVKEFPFRGAKIVASFSLPSFKANFADDNDIKDVELKNEFNEKLNQFNTVLNTNNT